MREGLSDRQLDVLELALRGLSHQQIADRLFLSVDTVKSRFRRTYAQLRDAQGRPASGALHAVALALQHGDLVFDPVRLQVVRPAGRVPLPVYADPEAVVAAGPPGERSVRERREALGW